MISDLGMVMVLPINQKKRTSLKINNDVKISRFKSAYFDITT